MPTSGRKPKEGPKLGHSPTLGHEWVQVPNKPYAGKKPALPASRTVTDRDGKKSKVKLEERTKAWWRSISSMPHCVLWTATDWEFALATAFLVDMYYSGDRAAGAEVRLRERIIGATADSRRDLRIRYVDRDEEPALAKKPPRSQANVTSIADERRRRLMGE